MKRFFRRRILKSRLARMTAYLDTIRREREALDTSEQHCVRAANALQLELLNLDVKARRHA